MSAGGGDVGGRVIAGGMLQRVETFEGSDLVEEQPRLAGQRLARTPGTGFRVSARR